VGLELITPKIFQCMLERTDGITNVVLEPITFVLAYPTLSTGLNGVTSQSLSQERQDLTVSICPALSSNTVAYILYRMLSIWRISAVCLAFIGDAWGCLPLTFTCYSLILLTINPAVYIHNTMLSNTSLHAASKYTQLRSKARQAVYPAQ